MIGPLFTELDAIADEVFDFVSKHLNLQAKGSLAKLFAFHMRSNIPKTKYSFGKREK